MKSILGSSMLPPVRRDLAKLGADIAMARRKRHLTTQMMVERVGVARSTYLRVEKGNPTVSLGIYAMAPFVLGFGDAIVQPTPATLSAGVSETQVAFASITGYLSVVGVRQWIAQRTRWKT